MVLPASPFLCQRRSRSIPLLGATRATKRLCWLWISSDDECTTKTGWKINHKRVGRVMQQAGLICRRKPRYVHTTDSNHSEPIYANLIKDLHIEAPNQCWVADLTYVRLPEGFVYLACLLDAYSRKCIGWCLSRKMDSNLPLQALEGDGFSRAPDCFWVHSSF